MHRASDEKEGEREKDQVEMEIGIQYKNHEMQCGPLIFLVLNQTAISTVLGFCPPIFIIIFIFILFSLFFTFFALFSYTHSFLSSVFIINKKRSPLFLYLANASMCFTGKIGNF